MRGGTELGWVKVAVGVALIVLVLFCAVAVARVDWRVLLHPVMAGLALGLGGLGLWMIWWGLRLSREGYALFEADAAGLRVGAAPEALPWSDLRAVIDRHFFLSALEGNDVIFVFEPVVAGPGPGIVDRARPLRLRRRVPKVRLDVTVEAFLAEVAAAAERAGYRLTPPRRRFFGLWIDVIRDVGPVSG